MSRWPAKAGQRLFENPVQIVKNWIPAFAGMTEPGDFSYTLFVGERDDTIPSGLS